MDSITVWIVIIGSLLILYHHIGYPLLLGWLSRRKTRYQAPLLTRGYQTTQLDEELPQISIIVPAYNEAAVIQDKIINLASLDYPADKLDLILFCDGCTDNTVDIAQAALNLPECKALQHQVIVMQDNQGKIAVINQAMELAKGEVVALTDASSLLSLDSMLRVASYFADPKIGVISAHYHLLYPGSEGELAYWHYQTRIMQHESDVGGALGVHGSCFFLRRSCFTPLIEYTINDDFVIPLKIVARGYRSLYVPDILALELEHISDALDHHRRERIAAGNLQQLIHLREILSPRFGATSFTFASGKALRVLMPVCLLMVWLSSLWLSFKSWSFALFWGAQSLIYALAVYRQLHRDTIAPVWLEKVHYVVRGHAASFIGTLYYLTGRYRKPWRRAKCDLEND